MLISLCYADIKIFIIIRSAKRQNHIRAFASRKFAFSVTLCVCVCVCVCQSDECNGKKQSFGWNSVSFASTRNCSGKNCQEYPSSDGEITLTCLSIMYFWSGIIRFDLVLLNSWRVHICDTVISSGDFRNLDSILEHSHEKLCSSRR